MTERDVALVISEDEQTGEELAQVVRESGRFKEVHLMENAPDSILDYRLRLGLVIINVGADRLLPPPGQQSADERQRKAVATVIFSGGASGIHQVPIFVFFSNPVNQSLTCDLPPNFAPRHVFDLPVDPAALRAAIEQIFAS